MKFSKLLISLALFVLAVASVVATPAGDNVVISEVLFNPEGSESGKEWIELYNPTNSAIDISLWSLQKEGQLTNIVTFPASTSIPAHSYILIGDDGTLPADLPTPDFIGIVTSLVNGGDGINLKDDNLNIVDAVGWFITDTNYFEGTAITSSVNGNSIERKQGGICGNAVDTDDNKDDFQLNPNPTPQNSGNASVSPCAPDTVPPGSVTGLSAFNITNESFFLSWTNPSDLDFDESILYIDGDNIWNGTAETVQIFGDGITPDTSYLVTVHTKDTEGNVNDTDVSITVRTEANPVPEVPRVVLTSPVNGSTVTTDSVLVTFNVSNWTVGGKGQTHIHFHIDNVPGFSFSDHFMFYNGADDIVEFNTVPGTTVHATWINDNTIQFNNVPEGSHRIRAHLADALHSLPGNPEADTFIDITVDVAECTIDDDCDDNLYCNGVETCVAGSCQAGTPVDVDDGVACTVDSCDEVNDEIDNVPTDSLCDNGLFCDGAETCDLTLGCQAGTPIVCDDGQYCNGVETCNEASDSCSAGTAVDTNDGVSCTVDSCDETNDVVVNTPNDGLCDNGLFCDGAETCHATLDCQNGAVVDCSANDISGVDTCTHTPDGNALTHDSRSAFTSTCNEATDSCEVGDTTIVHACSLACGAGCTSDLDCSANEVCDLNSCGCIPDGLPRITIDTPVQDSTVNGKNVTVTFTAENWNVSGKGDTHVHFHFNGTTGLSFSDHLMLYNGVDNIVELNTVSGETVFATWLSPNSFQLNNVNGGTHKLRAHFAEASHAAVTSPGADVTIEFTVNRPADPFCGDDSKNVEGEVCDGTDLNGLSCTDFGYSNAGGLACSVSCDAFDMAGCSAVCGDGNIEPGEQCDDSNVDDNDGCSSSCQLEHDDDLMINYLRGYVSFDGVNATNDTMYTVDILNGENAGMSFSAYLAEDGSFDTGDQLRFSTGASFSVSADNCNAVYNDTLVNGGNTGIHLDCTVIPEINDVYHIPDVPHDLEDTIVYANVTDESGNLDSVVLHYALNGTNLTVAMASAGGDLFSYNFGTLGYNSTVNYSVWAQDTYANMVMSAEESFTVISYDFDKDGSNVSVDCNDHDASIYPGAPEIVDAIDQNCVNDAPQLVSDILNQTWNEDERNDGAFDLDNHFVDVDDDGELVYSYIVTSNVNVAIDENNEVNFTQADNYHGTDSVVFFAADGENITESNSVSLTVVSVPDAPVFSFNISDIVVTEEDLVDVNGSGEVVATDADGDVLTYSYSCSPAPCVLDSNGQWQTAIGDKGVYEANVTVSDGALSETQTVIIDVTKKFEGDVNNDKVVNILDLIAVRQAFGLTSADAGWNPELDVNEDGVIDILDLIFIRTRFS